MWELHPIIYYPIIYYEITLNHFISNQHETSTHLPKEYNSQTNLQNFTAISKFYTSS